MSDNVFFFFRSSLVRADDISFKFKILSKVTLDERIADEETKGSLLSKNHFRVVSILDILICNQAVALGA